MWRRRLRWMGRAPLLAVVLAALLALTGAASGVAQDADGIIYACYSRTSGRLRVVPSPDRCASSEGVLRWNVQGPPGECDCEITREEFDALAERVTRLEESLRDADGDGYRACDDCNDYDPTVYPGAPEMCDGKDNNCDGQVDEGCGPVCRGPDDCPDDHYCAKRLGDCDGVGGCLPRPQGCPDVWEPVCGCDGRTYSNHCDAAAAGVSLRHEGECPSTPCHDNGACDPESYCAKPLGQCDAPGTCAPRPAPGSCPRLYEPVCGCDGETYVNRCEAARAGVSIQHLGSCIDTPCGHHEACGPDGYCAKAPGDCDGEGTCQPRPDACPEVYRPVCGCDGQTYDNECFAAAAGVNVATEGPCPSDECQNNDDCAGADPTGGDYCAKPVGECDGPGACEPRPPACPRLYDPVCGCDGQTYVNACEAARAGVSVLHEAPCSQAPCWGNPECSSDGYCARPPGECDSPGVCQSRPQGCPNLWTPVCGCDGQTYANPCQAGAAGINVAYEGECQP